MVIENDELKWNLFLKKWDSLLLFGINRGLIHTYDDELIERLRKVSFASVPASLVLLCTEECNHLCREMSLLLTHGLEDKNFRLVRADVDSIALHPENVEACRKGADPNYCNHWFVEEAKSDGTVWVYDTTFGGIIERDLYYEMQRPRIVEIVDKESALSSPLYQEVANASFDDNKDLFQMAIPMYEEYVRRGCLYSDELTREIEIVKREFDYEATYMIMEDESGVVDEDATLNFQKIKKSNNSD